MFPKGGLQNWEGNLIIKGKPVFQENLYHVETSPLWETKVSQSSGITCWGSVNHWVGLGSGFQDTPNYVPFPFSSAIASEKKAVSFVREYSFKFLSKAHITQMQGSNQRRFT